MALFVLSLCPFDISVGIGAFVIGLGQISSFLSLWCINVRIWLWKCDLLSSTHAMDRYGCHFANWPKDIGQTTKWNPFLNTTMLNTRQKTLCRLVLCTKVRLTVVYYSKFSLRMWECGIVYICDKHVSYKIPISIHCMGARHCLQYWIHDKMKTLSHGTM